MPFNKYAFGCSLYQPWMCLSGTLQEKFCTLIEPGPPRSLKQALAGLHLELDCTCVVTGALAAKFGMYAALYRVVGDLLAGPCR